MASKVNYSELERNVLLELVEAEKYPFLFLNNSACAPPGEMIGTWMQSIAPITPGIPAIELKSFCI